MEYKKTEKSAKTCAIVNAYSSGNLLAPAFARQGYKVIHVEDVRLDPDSTMSQFLTHTFHEDDFCLNIPATNVDAQAAVLKKNKVEFVLAGAECGVELADLLSEKLGLPGNGTTLSAVRRNKYEMIEAIRKAGLRTARQIKSGSLAQVLDFAKTLPEYDLIIKPLRNAGANLVFNAGNENDVCKVFEQTLFKKTIFDEVITELCVQERLKGEEFAVNTVSCGGKHIITEIWRNRRAQRNGALFLYDRTELRSPSDPQLKELANYTLQVVDALGIKWGPAHAEIMLTESGPVVIEVGARMAGSGIPAYAKAATGTSQVELTVKAYCNQEAFEVARRKTSSLKKNCVLVSLICEVSGRLKSPVNLQEIEKLPSFFQAYIEVEPGQTIFKTMDAVTRPGIIALIHEDAAVIDRDCATIRSREKSGFYEVEEFCELENR